MTLKRFAPKPFAHPAWLITFTDIMALMLTFFVLSYAMSAPPTWVRGTLQGSDPVNLDAYAKPDAASGGDTDTLRLPRVAHGQAFDLDYVGSLFETRRAEYPALASLTIVTTNDHILLSLPNQLLFASGKAAIDPAALPMIRMLADLLGGLTNQVEIVGHADGQPVRARADGTAPTLSNWTLSLERADALAAELGRNGYARPLWVRGTGSGQAGTRTDAASRRVDIVILSHTYKKLRRFGGS